MTLEELSDKTGIDAADIAAIEDGLMRPTPSQLISLADALDAKISWLFEGME